jgi:phosphatidylserine/phosphatidylglycerophosphate/cardiolipin synthase-like enzyme
VRIAHAKTTIIDGKVTLTGSMNWSKGSTSNFENLNLVVSLDVAESYAVHWRQRLAASMPYANRDDWCRPPRIAGSACERSQAPMRDNHDWESGTPLDRARRW